MTTAELESLIVSFNAASVVIEDLVKSSNQIIETNRRLNAMIDTKAYLDYTQGDIIKNLKQQNILFKSLIYLFESESDTVKEIIKVAQKNKDKEVIEFWAKRLNNEQ